MDSKIRIAFIKFGGLSAGGTEKFLQNIAANLNKDKFSVDYYYCDSAPYINSNYKHLDTDPERLKIMRESGINLIKFGVGFKDVTNPKHDWIDTNFWQLFDEDRYDVVFTGRAGHPEYPFYLIKKTPIIDSIHLSDAADNQKNIKKVIHLSEGNAKKWIKNGGDRRKIEILYQPIKIDDFKKENLKKKYGINDKFVFGFHQRNDDNIFSPIPLRAYAKIESKNNYFVILNSSDKYKKQAKELGIKNILFLPFAKKQDEVYNFLRMLDVYAHGRRDGEINSTAIAEAMAFGLPIVSHFTEYNNGHYETIGQAGRVVKNFKQYAQEMRNLQNDANYYRKISNIAISRFKEKYSFENQIKKIENIITEVATKKIKYSNFYFPLLLGMVYKIKFKVRCQLVKIVKYLLKKIKNKN